MSLVMNLHIPLLTNCDTTRFSKTVCKWLCNKVEYHSLILIIHVSTFLGNAGIWLWNYTNWNSECPSKNEIYYCKQLYATLQFNAMQCTAGTKTSRLRSSCTWIGYKVLWCQYEFLLQYCLRSNTLADKLSVQYVKNQELWDTGVTVFHAEDAMLHNAHYYYGTVII